MQKDALKLIKCSFIILLVVFSQLLPSTNSKSKELSEAKLRKSYRDFFNYFDIQDTIYFNQKHLIIGDITYFLNMGKANIIYDRLSDSLFYVDMLTDHYMSLTTQDVIPGYHLRPLALAKLNDKDFIVSSTPYYFIFRDGKIRRFYRTESRTSRKIAVGKGKVFLYCHLTPENLVLQEMDLHTGKLNTMFRLDEVGRHLRNLIYRNSINGGFVYSEKRGFFVSDAYENKIYHYNFKGKLVNIFRSHYHNFRGVYEDAAKSTPNYIVQFVRQLRKERKSFDVVYSIHLLNENIILAAYIINRKMYIELFNINNGHNINNKEIRVPFPIKYCADNFLFLERMPERMDQQGQIQNPYIIKCYFKLR